MLSPLTSHEALMLTTHFAFTADRMRATDKSFEVRASICETASRIAFLRAQMIARKEEFLPVLGEAFRRAAFAVV
jgi:hypothetical protein